MRPTAERATNFHRQVISGAIPKTAMRAAQQRSTAESTDDKNRDTAMPYRGKIDIEL